MIIVSRRIVVTRIAAVFTLIAGARAVQAAGGGTTRFWNLTGETITHLYLAPTGTTAWGADQCKNDPDGSVDFDERLRITGIGSGRYDLKFTDKTGRSCVVNGVEVKAGAVFSIDKDTASHCGQE
jgi:hypothetical protein